MIHPAIKPPGPVIGIRNENVISADQSIRINLVEIERQQEWPPIYAWHRPNEQNRCNQLATQRRSSFLFHNQGRINQLQQNEVRLHRLSNCATPPSPKPTPVF